MRRVSFVLLAGAMLACSAEESSDATPGVDRDPTSTVGAPAPGGDASGDVGARLLEGADQIDRPGGDFVSLNGSFEGLFTPGPPPFFTDCVSGEVYRFAASTAADSLFVGYTRLDLNGAPVGVTVEGHTLAAPDGTPSIRISGFRSFQRLAGCGEPMTDVALDQTEWELTQVLGRPVAEGSGASILFDRAENRVSGSTGCNSFTGAWEVVGTLLSLDGVGMTRMACPSELAQLETDVLEAFRLTGSYRILGDELQLIGDSGPVAVYRAR